ncbi:MAG TPA: hypothetical protein DDZ66_02275 [Firmicutes bacterium]|nr:hypothetical protein [Bacillota bacterium]
MANCIMGGEPIYFDRTEYIIDDNGNYWCGACAKRALARWSLFEKYEHLAEEPGRYKEALRRAISYMVDDGFCVDPKRRCTPKPEACARCWMEELTGDKEE